MKKQGFEIIEALFIVLVLALLVSIIIPRLTEHSEGDRKHNNYSLHYIDENTVHVSIVDREACWIFVEEAKAEVEKTRKVKEIIPDPNRGPKLLNVNDFVFILEKGVSQ